MQFQHLPCLIEVGHGSIKIQQAHCGYAPFKFSVQNYNVGVMLCLNLNERKCFFLSCTVLNSTTFIQNAIPLHTPCWSESTGKFGPTVCHKQLVLRSQAHKDETFCTKKGKLPKNLLWRNTLYWLDSLFSAGNSRMTSKLPMICSPHHWSLPTPQLKMVTNPLWVKCSHSLLETH